MPSKKSRTKVGPTASPTVRSRPPSTAIDDTPKELTEALQERRCAVFVGAGLSVAAGYPNWEHLLNGLIDTCLKLKDIHADQARELKAMVATKEAGNLLMTAQELSDRFGRERFLGELVKVFGDETKVPSSAHKELARIPFDLAITTNYDRLLERTYAKPGIIPSTYTHSNAPDFVDALWRKKFFVLKAHGDVDRKSEIVITERDYRDIIFRSQGYRSGVAAVFTTKTVLFVGVSLTDPETKLLLAYLHDAFHGSGAYHYALVPRDQFPQTVVSRWRKDYKVNCISYDATPGHPEVVRFLKTLPH